MGFHDIYNTSFYKGENERVILKPVVNNHGLI